MDKKNEKLFLTLFALGLTDSDGELCYEELYDRAYADGAELAGGIGAGCGCDCMLAFSVERTIKFDFITRKAEEFLERLAGIYLISGVEMPEAMNLLESEMEVYQKYMEAYLAGLSGGLLEEFKGCQGCESIHG